MISKILINLLCQFFKKEVPNLQHSYSWKIPQIDNFTQSGETGYQANLALKEHLKNLWEKAKSNDEKLKIATIIVSDWGGVRANRPKTLRRHVSTALQINPSTPLQGVASYSKILSIVNPNRFAIYDSRVAACLNAIQINAGHRNGLAFNYVSGRNNIIGNTAKKSGFTQDIRFSTRTLVQSGWTPIKKLNTYSKYLETLEDCLKQLPNYSLASLEMVLFSNAERECIQAMTSAKNPKT